MSISMSFKYPIDDEIDVCYYHAKCPDGICAAWSLHNRINNDNKTATVKWICPDTEFIGIPAGCKEFKQETYSGKVIIFVDVCPDEKSLNHMLLTATRIYILDHHVTNKELIQKYMDHPKLKGHVIFDMERSGCMITWDVACRNNDDNANLKSIPRDTATRPWFINCVGTHDLWKHEEYPNSKEIVSALCDLEYFTFEKLDELINSESHGMHIIDNILLPYIEKVTIKNNLILKDDIGRAAVATMTLIEDKKWTNDELEFMKDNVIIGQKYHVWVGSTLGHLISTFGNELAKKPFNETKYSFGNNMPDFAVIYSYDHWRNIWKYSLRSIAPFDVSRIASKMGGGGHAQAAGFSSKKNPRELFNFVDLNCEKNAVYIDR